MSANANSREANISATAQERGAASDRTPIHERIRGTEAHISATAQERGAASASRQRETPSRGYMAGTSAAGRHCRRAAVEPPYCPPADVGRRNFRIRRSSQGRPRFRESSIQGVIDSRSLFEGQRRCRADISLTVKESSIQGVLGPLLEGRRRCRADISPTHQPLSDGTGARRRIGAAAARGTVVESTASGDSHSSQQQVAVVTRRVNSEWP